MAVKGKGKQIAGKAPVNSSTKRKSPSAQAECSAAGGKKRRGGVLRFFDDAAADADLDEEEEDLDDDDVDLEDEEVDLDFGNEQSKYEKGAGKANPLPFFLKEEEMSGDELEALIRDRYAGGSDYVVYDEDKESGDIAAAELSLKDATIWRVKCMFGREQQIAFSLMQKFIDLQEFGTKLGIICVFALEHIKGYVYIEADKASDVAEACKGFCNIYSSRIGLVPSNEIPHLLVVRNKVCEVSKGTWVRMKNGKYKGDLGQVVAVDESRKRATIKMIPRVDLEAIAKKYGGGISLKNSSVPAQRLISSHELGHFGPHVEIRRDRETGEIFEVLDGLMFKDGYLYKKMAIGSLVHWGVQPTEHEILKFTETSKAEDGDLDWLSSVYEGRKRMRSTEASTSNGVTKEGSGYDLHELVFFGRKDFGIIISLGKDGIQILKGDAEGQVVVTVKSQEIKKGCDDKMFTASDCHMKTISINDLVKVSEGPMEGRQGIVRHMYKGTLFLYDENQEDNSGIFRAKSNICENIKQSRAFGKSGKKSSSSFSEPPMTSCDQEDNPRTFDRFRQRESDQTFSIGQTLRIKKGPLKGYLCRVVGVYRKKVTVKLDSLVKIITVEEQFLSVPNIRSDGCAAAPIGGLSDKGREPLGQSSWDGGRDSWQSLTSSSFPFANSNDQKSDQGEGDPWGSKLPLTTKDQGEGDPWGSKLPLTTNDADQEQAAAADPWGSKGAVVSRAESSDPWGKKVSVASKDQEQAAADPWGSKGAVVPRAESSDPWGKKVSTASKDQEQAAADPWGSKGAVVSRAEPSDPWGSKVPVASKDREQAAAADPWGSKGAVVSRAEPSDPWGSKVPVASKDREQAAADPWSSKDAVVSRDKKDQGDADPWGSSKMVTVTEDHGQKAESADPWGGKVSLASKANQEKSVVDPWGSKVNNSSNAENVTTWGNSSSQARPEADSWAIKGKSIVNNEVAWDKATEKSSVEDGGKTSSWDKVKTPISSQADQWGKGTSNATGSGGWNKSGFSNQSQKGEWNEEAVGNNQRNDWNKSGDFGGGRGFGRGRGRGRNTWGDNASGDQEGKWNKPINREGDGGSTWGSGWNHNAAAGGNQDQENSWSKQSDSPGGRGFGRGRGRGRYGGSGNRDDNQTKPYDSGGDWGRGRGRGRNDAGNFSNNFDDAGSFGRGRGRGRFDSSDWKNNQENFGDANLSKKSASSWGDDEQGEWTGGKSAVQGQSPKAQGDNQPSSWNQTSSTPGKPSSGWATNEERSWVTTPKDSPSGSQFSAWNKTAENKDAGKEASGAGGGWGSIKQFDDKKASDGNGAPGAGGNWDKAKPFNANQLSDWSGGEKKDWSSGKPLGEAPARNVSDDAYAGGDSWSKPGLLGARPAETNNWSEARSSGWKQNSPACEGKAGTNVGNWNKPKTFSGGNQSSGWGNDEGESWTKPNSFGGQSSWSDHTDGFNGGGGGDQSGGWGRGRNDQSCGGRGNSFSGRGRGRGRNFGGGRWNGGRGGNEEGNGSGDQPEFFSRGNTFASNQGGFASGGGSWNKGNESAGEHTGKNAGETTDKGSWDYSWKSESGKQPGGWAKQDSKGFEPPAPDGSNKNGAGGGSWDQPKQSGNSSGSGWTTGKTNSWNEKKPSDGKGQASGGWNTSAIPAKEDGGIGSSSKEADIGGNVSAWEKKEADIGGNGSSWEKKAASSWGNPKDGNSGGKGGW